MDDHYYKARISELERELAQAYADIKMLEARECNLQNIYDQEKLWELYRDANSLGMKPQHAMSAAKSALKVWKERK